MQNSDPVDIHRVLDSDEVKIKLLRIEPKIWGDKRRDAFRELFDWFAERRFRDDPPKTEEECLRVLRDEICQQVYDIAFARRWIRKRQVKRYILQPQWPHGPEVHASNEQARRDAFRIPTMADFRATWWADLILEWQARFLESRHAQSRPQRQPLEKESSLSAPAGAIASRDPEALINGKLSVTVRTAAHYLDRTEAHVRRLLSQQKLVRVGKVKPTQVSTESLRKYKGW